MRVHCRRIVSPVDGSMRSESMGVRIGAEYVVLTLDVYASGRTDIRIIDEDGTPSLWPGDMFETADETVSPNWVVRLDSAGAFAVGPRDWLRRGFWEDYYERVSEAVAQYERELSVILGEHVPLTLSPAQWRLLAGCVNEAIEAVDDWEFETRLGADKADARQLREELRELIDHQT